MSEREWMPIETLPGTDDPVLLYSPGSGVHIAPGKLARELTREQKVAIYKHSGDWHQKKFYPTHWQPLPPPPSA